jgi:hypothetical protein
MLGELLRLLNEGGVRSYQELTKILGVSEGLLEAMVEDLARLGYLRPVQMQCGQHCDNCHSSICSVVGRGRMWELTEKGLRASSAS